MSQIRDPQNLLAEVHSFMAMHGNFVPKDDPRWQEAYAQIKAKMAERGRDLDELNKHSPSAVDEFIQEWIHGKDSHAMPT